MVAEVDLLAEIAKMEVGADALVFHIQLQRIELTGLKLNLSVIGQHPRVGTGLEHAPVQALRGRALGVFGRCLNHLMPGA